jgi:putative membrane protein
MRDTKPLVILLIALVAIVALGATTMAWMMGGPMMGPSMMWGYGSQSGGAATGGWTPGMTMGIGWLMMLAFWGTLIVGVILLAGWFVSRSNAAVASEEPLRILQRRYVSGEIDEATYVRMKRELGATNSEVDADANLRRAS